MSSQWAMYHVDRDFTNGMYGGDLRLISERIDDYREVKGISYDEEKLILKTNGGQEIILENEPSIEFFKSTIYKQWQVWHKSVYPTKEVEDADEDSCDYEPWALKDKNSITSELGLIKNKETSNFVRF